MKGRLVALVGVFCIACLIVSGANAKGKPDKPGKPDQAECIVFTGDLASVPGGTVVEGCCPNAGPSPPYTMTLDLNTNGFADDIFNNTYEGQLFINDFRRKPSHVRQYTVQFWTWDWDTQEPGTGDYFFQIYGGNVENDRQAKFLTVTFESETGTGWVYDDDADPIEMSIPDVSFVLERTSDLAYCE